MNIRLFVLPSLCLAGAALLLAPARPSHGFGKHGHSLGESERDFRVFNNFINSEANDNQTPHGQFPGRVGAALALWKGAIEWGSSAHGDGTGDPVGGNVLGSGGANFDPMWAGNASGIGGVEDNIASGIDCGGIGLLAYTEIPIVSGWRIRFCNEVIWDDGPGAPFAFVDIFDLQSVMVAQYGHALGIAHSSVPEASMWPTHLPRETLRRSLHSDDVAGIQCIYGIRSCTKPIVTATLADMDAGTLTIHGTQFGATDNEVWFTPSATSAAAGDPIARVTGVSSSNGGTLITVSIPAGAGQGDVMVNKSGSGGATLSNAFPTDLEGTFGVLPSTAPLLTCVSPSSIEALIPGTAETITLTGIDLDLTTGVLLDGDPLPSSTWTLVSATTITLDMPQVDSLGIHDLGVTAGGQTSQFAVTIVSPSAPRLQWGNGNAGNAVSRAAGLDMIVSGTPGELHVVRGGPSPSSLTSFQLKLGFVPHSPLLDGGAYIIPAKGWTAVHLNAIDPAQVGLSWFAHSYAIVRPRPFLESNLQSISLIP